MTAAVVRWNNALPKTRQDESEEWCLSVGHEAMPRLQPITSQPASRGSAQFMTRSDAKIYYAATFVNMPLRHDVRNCRYTVFALVELLSKLGIQVFSKVLIVPLHYSSKYDPTTDTVALYIIHRNMHKAAVSWLMNIQNTIMSVAVVPFPFRLSLLCAP